MGMAQKLKDRFRRLKTDPRFRRLQSQDVQQEVDKQRFGALFTDPDFQIGTAIDKRGAKNQKRKNFKENLERYYKLKDEEEFAVEGEAEPQTEDQEQEKQQLQQQVKKLPQKSNQEFRDLQSTSEGDQLQQSDSDEESEEQDEMDNGVKRSLLRIRGMLEDEQSSSSSEEQEYEEEDLQQSLSEEEIDLSEWGAGANAANPDEDVPVVQDSTQRLAAVDLDWQKVRAVDILCTMQSFLPQGGRITCVTVYPSDYGLEQMEKESIEGPEAVFQTSQNGNSIGNNIRERDDYDEDEEEEESDEHDEVKSRVVIYERSKLRWYYAVIECDSRETAEVLYNECDGFEFEGTACKFDLRYIPDDMSFDGRNVRDEAKVVPDDYKPPFLTGQVPIHTNPQITWDKDCEVRKRALKYNKKSNDAEMEFDDYKAYLASASSDEEDDKEKEHNGKPSLLASVLKEQSSNKSPGWDSRFGAKTWGTQNEESTKDVDMEIKFIPALEGLKDKAKNQDDKKAVVKGLSVWREREQKLQERNLIRKKQGKYFDEENDDQLDDDVDYQKRKSLQKEQDIQFSESDEDDQFPSDDEDKYEEQSGSGDDLIKDHTISKSKQNKKKRKRKDVDPELELIALDDRKLMDKVRLGDHQSVEQLDKKQSKKKRRKLQKANSDDEVEQLQFDIHDERFQSVFENPEFGVDPSNPQFNEYSQQVIKEIAKRKNLNVVNEMKQSSQTRLQSNDNKDDVQLKLQVKQMKSKFQKTKNKRKKLQS
eukprot:TRINITY_DN8904_c0_g2_i3.p1 TRINITY_DN8904_c0_g2~~TRINITY_DN8904_c0_g2_i3.p1  ORF type:complete len:760 (-),score=156.28 TRINITY_DN8904_c0_g2_i3:21-2300(-)